MVNEKLLQMLNFNSIKVRLKLDNIIHYASYHKYFNSIKVRLKRSLVLVFLAPSTISIP